MFAPDGMDVLHVDIRDKFKFKLKFVKKPRIKTLEAEFNASDFDEKGLKANGIRLDTKEVSGIEVETDPDQMKLF